MEASPPASSTRKPGNLVRTTRPFLVLLGGLAATLLLGCHNDEDITHYQVPKAPAVPLTPLAGKAKVRLLGAIIPREERTWFLKMVGPTSRVQEQEDAFSRFVSSIHFPK